MTNFEKIKKMSVDELAQLVYFIKTGCCIRGDFCKIGKGRQCICFQDKKICLCGLKQWLESEAENE